MCIDETLFRVMIRLPYKCMHASVSLCITVPVKMRMPLVTMGAIAIVAMLNGIIVHMIMIARVIYGLADQGSLPKALTRL